MADEVSVQRRQLMLDLPSTADLDGIVERLEATEGRARIRLQRDLDWARYRRDLGRERDAIQCSRPADCWCLGLGGRTPTGLMVFDPPTETSQLVPVWYLRCPHCDDGRAAEAHYQLTLRQATRSVTAQRLSRLFGQPALADYRDASLETVDVRPENAATWGALRAWADGEPSMEGGLLLWGSVGTGKTFAAVALLRRRVELGDAGLFLTESGYLQEVRNTYGDGAEATTAQVQHAACTVPLLVLDDVGAETLSPWGETQIRELLSARMNGQVATVFTSNHDPLSLREVREERIVSRILGLCGRGAHVYEWSGADRRWG